MSTTSTTKAASTKPNKSNKPKTAEAEPMQTDFTVRQAFLVVLRSLIAQWVRQKTTHKVLEWLIRLEVTERNGRELIPILSDGSASLRLIQEMNDDEQSRLTSLAQRLVNTYRAKAQMRPSNLGSELATAVLEALDKDLADEDQADEEAAEDLTEGAPR